MQQPKTFQNAVTSSSLLLPVAAALCLILWILGNPTNQYTNWIELVFCAICTILMVELNKAYMLVRIRTYMVGTTLMVLWSYCSFLQPFQAGHIVVLCIIICYHALFYLYQQQHSTGFTFLIFTCLGIASMIVKPLCFLVPVFFFTLSYFRSLTFKSFFAGLIGFILPFWILFSICFLTDRLDLAFNYIIDQSQFIPFQYEKLNIHQLIPLALLSVIVIPSIIHFIQNNYQDKIRIRMFYYFILWMELFLAIGILILPNLFSEFYLLLAMNSSPLIAHFFTLTRHKATNILFKITLLLIIVFSVYDRWMLFTNFF